MPTQSKTEKIDNIKKEGIEIHEGILKERGLIIQAHCVKHMKANKELMHIDLVQRVMASI
jgi:hypothetical protein